MLGEQGVQIEERLYFKHPPTEAEVRELAAITPGGVRSLVSTRSRKYKELGLADKSLSDEEWVSLLAREPGLWRRPVVIRDGRVVIGYDAEAITDLIK